MAEKFVINGGNKLKGELSVRGAKNAAGPLIAASILTNEDCVIFNIPKVSDIFNLLDIIASLGKKVEWIGERTVKIGGEGLKTENLDFDKVSRCRISALFMGSLLARISEFKFYKPGGDRIGVRPIETHIEGFRELGAEIAEEGDFYYIKNKGLNGAKIILPEFSVTATENLIMASSLSSGETLLRGVAQETHVQLLIEVINKMGGKVEKVWPNALNIKGVSKLKGFSAEVIPDSTEAATFFIMGACCGENLVIQNFVSRHLELFLLKMKKAGVNFEIKENSVKVEKADLISPLKIQSLPYPGFQTDIQPLMVPFLTQAHGKSAIHDPLYENRLNYIQELRKMGADIDVVDPHRALIYGPTPLKGITVESWDIRAGASLIESGLIARGQTIIKRVEQIDRGYENLEERLKAAGADIKREEEQE